MGHETGRHFAARFSMCVMDRWWLYKGPRINPDLSVPFCLEPCLASSAGKSKEVAVVLFQDSRVVAVL